MVRPGISRLLRCCVLGVLLVLGGGTPVGARQVEDVTFPTNVVPNTSADRPLQVKAKLYIPDKAKYPVSLMIISPSSGGVREEREIYYATELLRAGIAALVVDSFASRDITNSVRDQSKLNSFQSGNDVVGAARWALADGRFKSDRIGIMGVSKGGNAAMNMAETVRRRWMKFTDMTFAAHIPIAPDCTNISRSMGTTGAPMFFMLAELDDQTPAAPCVEHAERLRKAGNSRIEVKVYKGAHHGWERLGASAIFDPKAQNFARCRLWTEENGVTTAQGNVRLNDGTITPPDGVRIPRGEVFAWVTKNCMTLGTHCCGGTRALRDQATADILSFLKRQGF
jgi:dienelactone hydrolase